MEGKTMPTALFQRLVDETAPYCKSYSLFNWGEPLILTDFRERVRYVRLKKRQDCNIEISTNGMLLTGDMIRFLRGNEVRVIVSFDGADKAAFEKIRRGAVFERIRENAKKLNRAYKDTPLDFAPSIYTSVQKDNQSELARITETVSALGFRRIGFGLVTAPVKFAALQDESLCRELQAAYDSADKNEMFLELYPSKVGEYVYSGDRYVPAEDFVVRTRCDAPLVNAVVKYDGEVCLCCNYGAVAGDVTDKSFLELWQSPRYDELREAVNHPDKMPEPCRRCWWVNR
ncbi:MAG: SPASM domain-containing protein [Firmicutes bacterium]|nr:SPASM domain-containing protein [Bacillota bacterium]